MTRRSICAVAGVLVGLAVSTGSARATIWGPPAEPVPTGRFPDAVVVADFNGDHRPDLAVVDSSDARLTIALDRSDGALVPAAAHPATGPGRPTSIATTDVNEDGRPDLVVTSDPAGPQSADVTVLLGNGDGTFTLGASLALPEGVDARALSVGDLNGDGHADLVMGQGGLGVATYLGDGHGGFAPGAGLSAETSVAPLATAVGDVDGDGRPDVVVSGFDTTNAHDAMLEVLHGDGQGGLVAAGSLRDPDAAGATLLLHDLNGDGRPDAVVGGGAGDVGVFLGHANGNFTTGTPVKSVDDTWVYPSSGGIALADVDGDGRPDLVDVDTTSSLAQVFLGRSDGTFAADARPTVADRNSVPEAVAVADFDGDGHPDIAAVDADQTADPGDGHVTVVRNESRPAASSAGAVSLGPVDLGRSATATVTARSTGEAALHPLAAHLSGPDAGDFAVGHDGCAGRVIGPGSSCSLTVTFTPAGTGSRAAMLTLSSDAGPIAVTLRGQGASPCHVGRAGLPDHACTPGAARRVTRSQVCSRGFVARAPHASSAVLRAVFLRYGITGAAEHRFHVDRLIPTELGGDRTLPNLWPQRIDVRLGVGAKDRLERRLRARVCSGRMTLSAAQAALRRNWLQAARRFR